MQKPRSFPERGLLFVMGIKLSIVLTLEQGCNATHCFILAKEKKRGTRRRKPTKEEEQGEKKRKAHYMSLHQKVKTADSVRKNF